MDTLKQVILAVIQGITELLPISSSAHLLLSSQILNLNIDTYFLTTLHIGTTFALLLFFAELLFKNIFSKEKMNMYLKILVSSIPVAIIGLLFESAIEESLRANIFLSISLIFWGILMIVTENLKKNPQEIKIENVSWRDSLIMGASQILALIPGTSRSGVTTVAGLMAGVNKYTAIQYSFILGIPVLVGASFYELYKNAGTQTLGMEEIVAIVVSGIVGYITLHFLNKFKKSKWLTVFGIYRIILGLIIILTGF